MLGIIKPKYFIPVHGEQKHLRKHAGLALSMGMDPKNILIADNGVEVLYPKRNSASAATSRPAVCLLMAMAWAMWAALCCAIESIWRRTA